MPEKEKKEKKGRREEPRQEKRGYIIAKDLKAAGPLVPQLQEAGYVKWAAGFAGVADVMQWQDALLDLESEGYDFKKEDPAWRDQSHGGLAPADPVHQRL